MHSIQEALGSNLYREFNIRDLIALATQRLCIADVVCQNGPWSLYNLNSVKASLKQREHPTCNDPKFLQTTVMALYLLQL
jgi:hypothetical protein